MSQRFVDEEIRLGCRRDFDLVVVHQGMEITIAGVAQIQRGRILINLVS